MLNLLVLKYIHLQFVTMLTELKKVLSQELKCVTGSSYSRVQLRKVRKKMLSA